ncbi:hypothetical protein B0T25DRAFT_559566 [Lasiosphaeria hispida]|uniref:Uncharacterized protein n=1 Tax=Lasiosphaeria hispida TaxID=260671 RepID=A0AAJ0H7X3_9PEZI|nr:hypothetical protein B0T25DRAFT_559566 [Lasiosphaeria hispida]
MTPQLAPFSEKMQPDSVQQWLVETVQQVRSEQKEMFAILKQLQQDVASKISLPCPATGCRSKFGAKAHLNRHIRDFASKPVDAAQIEHKKAAENLGLSLRHDASADIDDYSEADLHNGAAPVFRSGLHTSPSSGPVPFWHGSSQLQLPQRLQMSRFPSESGADQPTEPLFYSGNMDLEQLPADSMGPLGNFELGGYDFSKEIGDIDISALLDQMPPDNIVL